MSVLNRANGVTALVAAMAAILAVPAMADRDDDDRRSGPKSCSRHANLLFQACKADRQDDYLVHKADCLYVTPQEDQASCLADAREESRDKAEECRVVYQARLEVCDLVGEQRFDIEFDPEDVVHPNDIGESVAPNPYWPLTAGHTHVIVGEAEDDDGEVITEVTVVTATDEVRDVGGLKCRVVRDLVFEESENDEGNTGYDALEVTQDWYAQLKGEEAVNGLIAQAPPGDVIYCGENTYEVEDGLVDNTDGSFANAKDRARAGFLVRANPVVGEGDRQEMASDEAEDYVEYVALETSPQDDDMAYPCEGKCLQTFEVNPRDPGQAEYKYYLPGTGFVLAVKLDEDGVPTGEREEVTCVGKSLDVLGDLICGIADQAALEEALCLWAPDLSICGD